MKKTVGLILLVLMGFAPAAFADVSFYGVCNYQGPEVKLGAGNYTADDLAKQGIPEDAINSIKVPDGFTVTLFEDDNFSGRYGTLRSNDACLEDDNFDKLVSSLTIVEAESSFGSKPAVVISEDTNESRLNSSRRAITLYSECDYKGRSATIGVGEFNNSQLNKLGLANNSISSIKVGKGFQAELYINDFHRGRSGTLQRNNSCLNADYNDEVSSIVVQKTSDIQAAAPTPVVTLYTHCNYRGGSVQLPAGQYDAAALKDARVQNDTVSSVKVSEGYTVTVYEGDSYDGKRVVLTADDDCLDNDGMNEQLSSIVIESVNQRATQSSSAVAKPATSSTRTSGADKLQAGLDCVKQYVEQGACDAQRMGAIEKRCQLDTIAELSDGYLKGHIEAGNCTAELWDELVQRTSNPRLR